MRSALCGERRVTHAPFDDFPALRDACSRSSSVLLQRVALVTSSCWSRGCWARAENGHRSARTKGFDAEEDRLSARKRPNSSQDLTKELIEELVTQKEHV
ncbi:hypothetical protein R3I93_005906 [Phoxinus phoxinus]|uniref:Uncharacterized protein n=1 Tax=Phoxinus phoxinus TaxID=58324 RepID=A0AAN9HAU1_9TELE